MEMNLKGRKNVGKMFLVPGPSENFSFTDPLQICQKNNRNKIEFCA